MKTKLKMLMTRKAFESVAMILGILVLGTLGMATWGTLVVILVVYFILNYGIPSKYTPHVATLEAMLVAGGLAALLILTLFKNITSWLIWAGVIWLAISLATSMFRPFRFLTKAEDRNSIWPLDRPSNGRGTK